MKNWRWIGLAALLLLPWLGLGNYVLHIAILVLLWAYVYTAWAMMGRFGLVSLGHGAFTAIGAYGTTLLWNAAGMSPWIGIPLSVALAMVAAVVIGWPCFRFRIVGHYFALVTLALSEVVRLIIIALRDYTGGSLGMTPNSALTQGPVSLYALQFADKTVWYYIVLAVWVMGLVVWQRVDRSMARMALEAISDQEDAAASVGVDVTRTKLQIAVLSAALAAFGGALFGQYQLYVNPDIVGGIGLSLQIVFASIAGGMFVQLGPTVGAIFTLLLTEILRVAIGHDVHGLDTTIYGLMLVVFIIFMPKGIVGTAQEMWQRRGQPARKPA
ncbi:MAG TPA: branched-chain amino acid ABC transporter permease [Alphaproteobacteria bacterium]|nr:branched-chain amino acid ABC transporter permease [Alphaproteobacteria bacterium]